MPLQLLVAWVVAGVALVGLATWFAARPPPPLNDARARARFAEDYPERTVLRVAVASDGSGALLWLDEGCALVFAVGDGLATRCVSNMPDPVDGCRTFRFSDVATPSVTICVAEEPHA